MPVIIGHWHIILTKRAAEEREICEGWWTAAFELELEV